MNSQTLQRMIEQIAANAGGATQEDAINRIAVHLRGFWAPVMVTELVAAAADGSVVLSDNAAAGLALAAAALAK